MLMFEAGESKFKDNILGSEILSEKKHFLSVMNYVPPHRFWPIPSTCGNKLLFGNNFFVEDQVKMKLLGWTPIQCDWCHCKRWHLDTKTT